jgi:Mn-dependent DtxR family transcriptional regulator
MSSPTTPSMEDTSRRFLEKIREHGPLTLAELTVACATDFRTADAIVSSLRRTGYVHMLDGDKVHLAAPGRRIVLPLDQDLQ